MFKGQKILVVGAGKTGVATSRFLAGRGARVTLADIKTAGELEESVGDLGPGIHLVLGGYPQVTPALWDLVVVSPGVPPTAPPVKEARETGVPVTGEIELAFRLTRAPVVAITGTNGKTTTTALTGEIFRQAGYRTLVGGNIGVPLIDKVETLGPEDVVVAEVSSFQLVTTQTFRPRVAVILNITPDHIDWHGDFEAYVEAKARIFRTQGPTDFTVLNFDDQVTAGLAGRTLGQVIFFSRTHRVDRGVFVQAGKIVAADGNATQEVCAVEDLLLPGLHNLENALAAVAAAWSMGVDARHIASALRTFRGVTHRLELVAEHNGVKYVNDSKGTNPDAAIKALDAYGVPIILIAGGRNKGGSFTSFAAKVKEKVRVLILLGESAPAIEAAVRAQGFGNVLRATTLSEAVKMAHRAARPGEVVLLSPACASWDMFANYEERGNLFKKVVRELVEGEVRGGTQTRG